MEEIYFLCYYGLIFLNFSFYKSSETRKIALFSKCLKILSLVLQPTAVGFLSDSGLQ